MTKAVKKLHTPILTKSKAKHLTKIPFDTESSFCYSERSEESKESHRDILALPQHDKAEAQHDESTFDKQTRIYQKSIFRQKYQG